MMDLGYIIEDIFIERRQNFQKHRCPGKCLLISDERLSRPPPPDVDYCRENYIEILCPPSHTTRTLQPPDRTVFKPIKRQQTLCLNSPNAAITTYRFGACSWQRPRKVLLHRNVPF